MAAAGSGVSPALVSAVSVTGCLLALALADWGLLAGSADRPRALPYGWRMACLLGHSAAFFVCLVGFIGATEARHPAAMKLSLITLGGNMAGYLLRVSHSLVYLDYEPERFRPAA
eukprot:jgi/Chlat1/7521/Chrsp61S07022